MNIFIITLGTRGDVQPYVALGRGLQARGHRVTVCTSARFEPFIVEQGLAYGHMTDDIMKLIDSDTGREAVENTTNMLEWLKTARKLAAQVAPLQRQMVRDGWAAADAARPDIILFHPKAFGGPHYAEKLGVPAMMASPLPIMVPTAEFPSLVFPQWGLGGAYNRFTYWLTLKLTESQIGKYVHEWRTAVGLPRWTGRSVVMTDGAGSPLPVIHGYSPLVAPEPADWPTNAHATGYWFLERLDEWEPEPALTDFLAAGPPPVYIGFGSMAGRDPARITTAVVDGVRQAGVRAIIATGWGGLEAENLPDAILKIDGAPHDWLFPRVAAVVHHGGAGTTAAGLRAGRPSIICPFFGDQPFWGRRVAALGVGPAPIPQKQLTAARLAAAIGEMMGDVEMQAQAVALGARLQAEDGVARAIRIIEETAGGR